MLPNLSPICLVPIMPSMPSWVTWLLVFCVSFQSFSVCFQAIMTRKSYFLFPLFTHKYRILNVLFYSLFSFTLIKRNCIFFTDFSMAIHIEHPFFILGLCIIYFVTTIALIKIGSPQSFVITKDYYIVHM